MNVRETFRETHSRSDYREVKHDLTCYDYCAGRLCRAGFDRYFVLDRPGAKFDIVLSSDRPRDMEGVYKVRVKSSTAEAEPVIQFWHDRYDSWEGDAVTFYSGVDRLLRRALRGTPHGKAARFSTWGRPFYIWVEQ